MSSDQIAGVLVFILVPAAIVLVWIHYFSSARESDQVAAIAPREVSPLTEEWEEARYPGSAQFDAVFSENIAPLASLYFQTRIAGPSYRNTDDMRRTEIIKKCKPFDELRLSLEPDNPVDPKAIAVRTKDGKRQLGYLSRADAGQLHEDAGKPFAWNAIFKHANRDPESERVVGASIILVRVPIPPET